MKMTFLIVITTLSFLISLNPCAAEKDSPGCKDHSLAPRMEGYYIVGCDDHDAVTDFEVPKGKETETVHVEGKSVAIMYSPQPELKQKPTESKLKTDFESAMKKQGGAFVTLTVGQKWPVYKLTKDGKEYWIVLLVDSGQYFDGSYTVRVIERKK